MHVVPRFLTYQADRATATAIIKPRSAHETLSRNRRIAKIPVNDTEDHSLAKNASVQENSSEDNEIGIQESEHLSSCSHETASITSSALSYAIVQTMPLMELNINIKKEAQYTSRGIQVSAVPPKIHYRSKQTMCVPDV